MKAPRVALVGLKLESNRFSRPADIDDFESLNLLEGEDLPEKTFEIDTAGLTSPVLDRWNFNHIKRPSYPLDNDTVWLSPKSLINNET